MPKLVDILDARGRKSGKAFPIDVAHRKGLFYGSSHVWLYDEGVLLFQRRSQKALTYPGLLDISAAGPIVAGERPLDAAIRITWEELGAQLDVRELSYWGRLKTEKRGDTGICRQSNHIFFYEIPRYTHFRLSPEVAEVVPVAVENFARSLQVDEGSYVPRGEYYLRILQLFQEL